MSSAQATADIIDRLRESSPSLAGAVDALAAKWLSSVVERLKAISEGRDDAPRAKHINDPVWRTFQLEPHEVLLIDSPLLQRMRGIKQLGLANLVFPAANHDRFEHLCGTVQAAERVFQAVRQNADRRREAAKKQGNEPPNLTDGERMMVRLAALLHDVGHGPFSHAIEPVVAVRYGNEVAAFNKRVKELGFLLDAKIAVAELISILIVLSPTMRTILGSSLFAPSGTNAGPDLQLRLATLIMGARRHDQLACLSAIISGQVDADKLDYMPRDALHSGMPIEFDTERLLWKLEVVRCTPQNLPANQEANRLFAADSPDQCYFDLGIAASGVGALEQMLIGRAFLYDRLYHHHKVRAADAMAQRMLHYARTERGRDFELGELYQAVSDDTMIRLFTGDLTVAGFEGGRAMTAELGRSILDRELYVRAFAFRASFHTAGGAEKDEQASVAALAEAWSPVSSGLAELGDRLAAESAIVSIAKRIAPHLGVSWLSELATDLNEAHVIVDLAENRVKPVTINVHAEDGSLEAPTLFFDPARWSQVYDLQKRTGYVFCARRFVPLIAIAAKIFFFEKWGYAVTEKGDRLAKTSKMIKAEWIDALVAAGEIDQATSDVLRRERITRLFLREGDVQWPDDWASESAEFDANIVDDLRVNLPQGLAAEDLSALRDTLSGLASFVRTMHADSTFTTGSPSEKDLQTELRKHLRARGLVVSEGEELGGGEADLIVSQRMLVENKIEGATSNPFGVRPTAPYQANRYAVAKCSRVFCTLIAYEPKEGAAPIEQTQSIRIEKLDGVNRTAINIKVVVPIRMPTPSTVKVPEAARKPRRGANKAKAHEAKGGK